jgi:hypothetical protein
VTRLRLALLFAIYLSLDFSNPLMPGAVSFGVGESSVEARHGERPRVCDIAPAPLPNPVASRRPPAPRFTPIHQPSRDVSRVWQACLRQSQPARSGSAPLAEDA